MAANGFTIYAGIERAMADTPKIEIYRKFVEYANNTLHAKAFKENLQKLISNELSKKNGTDVLIDDDTSLDVLKSSAYYNMFVSAFTKHTKQGVAVLYDPIGKKFKVFKSTTKDESQFQFDEWSKNFISLNRQYLFYLSNVEITFKCNLSSVFVFFIFIWMVFQC